MIYLVRHGQTRFNAEKRWQGQVDSPLSALGEAQARAMGMTLSGLVDPASTRLIASPLGRAMQTATIIRDVAGIEGAIETDARLMEVGMGCWDGKTEFEIAAEYPGSLDGLEPHDWFFHSPDGETYDTFAARVGDVLLHLTGLSGDTVVVAHGVSSRLLRGIYSDLCRNAALNLDVPQDVVFALGRGKIARHPASASR